VAALAAVQPSVTVLPMKNSRLLHLQAMQLFNPTQLIRRRCPYLTLHCPFFLPTVDEAFADTVALSQEASNHTGHLPGAVVALDYGLVLINDHGDALKKRSQRGNIVQWGRRCNDLAVVTRTHR